MSVCFGTTGIGAYVVKAGRIFYGWYVVAAAMLANMFLGSVLAYGFPVFMNAFLAEFGWSLAAVALAYGVYQLQGGALAPLYGWIIDRWGMALPMFLGGCLGTTGFAILSQTDSLAMYLLGFGLAGLGLNIYWPVSLTAPAVWFPTRRTLAMGISLTGYGLAGFLVPLLSWGVSEYGLETVCIFVAVASIVWCIPLSLVMWPKPDSQDSRKIPIAEDNEGDDSREGEELPHMSLGEVLRSKEFWICSALYTSSWLPLAITIPHLLVFLERVGIQSGDAAFVITGITVGTIAGRLLGGYLADRSDKRGVMAMAHVMLAVAMLSLAFASEVWHVWLFVLLIGPAYGASSPVLPSIIGDIFGVKDYAKILGFTVVPGTIIWFVAPSAVGLLVDSYDSYFAAWMVTALFVMLCSPLAFLLSANGAQTAEETA